MDKATGLIQDFLRAQEALTAQVTGDCMAPVIPNGSLVSIRRRNYYSPGDIVAFCDSKGQLVCHRFLGYARSRGCWKVITKADNAQSRDGLEDTDSVLGRVVGVNQQPLKIAEIVEQLLGEYEVDRPTLNADLAECIADLESRGIIFSA